MSDDAKSLAQRVRRQTRSPDVIALCDAVEELSKPKKVWPKRDRKEYMRLYMRRRRAEQKQERE